MAISFEPSENTVKAKIFFNQVAREQMRPISRKYDEQEHEMPWEFVRFMWEALKHDPWLLLHKDPSDEFCWKAGTAAERHLAEFALACPW